VTRSQTFLVVTSLVIALLVLWLLFNTVAHLVFIDG
jgi:hypothetical protein